MKLLLWSVVMLMAFTTSHAAVLPGGSNFNWFHVDKTYSGATLLSCNREPYGVVAQYNSNIPAIQARLQSMYNAGQRRLRLMIFHGNGISSGTVMDSAGGNLSAQHRSNLASVLTAARNTGFVEVVVALGPQGSNDPGGWSSWNQARADENWSVITNLRPIVAASGMTYRLDLGNELMTTSTSNMRARYIKYIWPKYFAAYGGADTVGFSFAPGQIDAISNMVNLYGQNFPALGDVHIYPYGSNTYNSLLIKAANKFGQFGTVKGSYGFIIGEVYFNDLYAAQQLAGTIAALNANQSKPFYLLQWPLAYSEMVVCPDVSVPDVSTFSNYSAYGF